MPISYHIDPDKDLILVVASGVLTDEDLMAFRNELINDPLFHRNMKELGDFRPVERHEHDREGYRQFIEQEIARSNYYGDLHMAIVTNSDLHYGLSRVYKAHVADVLPHVNVFRDMDEAKAWLFGESEE